MPSQPFHFLATILFMHLPAFGAPPPTEADIRKACSDNSGADMRDCVEAKAKASAVILRKAERRMYAKLAKWDENEKYIVGARISLKAANREFIRYRAQQCAFNATLIGSSIGREMVQNACIAELNLRRAAQIEVSFSDLRINK